MRSVFCANKPYGISSHQVDQNKPGFVEWLSKQKQQSVLLCHRLDKTTTGCFVATTDREACAQVGELWSQGQVQKTYLFITDKAPKQNEWSVSSPIEGKNAVTNFRVLKSEHSHHLIEATPLQGRTHQIRIHAQESQIPILGDTTYGGSRFPLIFLHCQRLRSEYFDFSTQPPPMYNDLSLLQDPLLCQWLISYDRRQRLYPDLISQKQSLRLVHDEGTPLRVDLMSTVAHAGWWSDSSPTEKEQQSVRRFFDLINIKEWTLQNYGKSRSLESKFFIDQAPATWTAKENGITYEMAKSIGAAPGLFLDQREHRQWLQQNCKDKKILNLFAYTAGFSLNAAQGGASEVVTVDLSRKYIQWSKKNFALNNLTDKIFKFYDMDSFAYLKYATKKELKFDVIVCDPPSFSRHEKTNFRIEKDFAELINLCLSRLNPGGVLLFSTNFEQWDFAEWAAQIKSKCNLQNIEFSSNFSMQWDFDWHSTSSHLKAFCFRRK